MQRRDSPPARRETAHRCLYLCKDRHFSYKIRCIMPIFRIEGGSAEVLIYVMRVRWLPLSVCAKVQGIEVRAVHGLVQAKNRPRQPSPERLFAFPEKFFPKSKIFFTACQIIFITNFVTHITNLLIRVTNFVTLVRNFVTKTILYERKKYLGHRKNFLAYPKK